MSAMPVSRPHSVRRKASRFVPVAVAGSGLGEVRWCSAIRKAYDNTGAILREDSLTLGLSPAARYPVPMPRLASTFVCLALLIAACIPADQVQPTTTIANGVPVPSTTSSTLSLHPDGFGGHITVGIDATPTTLNPFDADALEATRIVGNAVWATVYDIDPLTWERIPDNVTALPASYDGGIKTNADGSMTVQYQVARRATWSDGVPMTGADLAFTAETMRDLASAGNPNVDPVMASVVSTDSLDQIAWVTFAEPSLAFEDALWIILPSHALEGIGIANSDATTWPSGGPFRVDGSDLMSLVRNPNYWKSDEAGRQLPYADSLSFVESGNDPVESFPVARLTSRNCQRLQTRSVVSLIWRRTAPNFR